MVPPPSFSPTGSVVIRSLYRSLLRASSPFSSPSPSSHAYASLLHRSGVSHDWEECVYGQSAERERRRGRAASASSSSSSSSNGTTIGASAAAVVGGGVEGNIPESWAMDLSRSYDDLREEYALLRRRRRDGAAADTTNEDEDGPSMGQDDGEDYYYCADEDPKFVLFRHLLRELFAGGGGVADGDCGDGDWEDDEDDWDDVIDNPAPRIGRFPDRKRDWPWKRRWSADESGYYQNGRVTQVPLMRFPCQISGRAGPSIGDLVRREFRARSAAEERATTGGAEDANVRPPSSYVDDAIRVQTAFYALAELNRKSAWAERMGFPTAPSPSSRLGRIDDERLLELRRRRRSVQAARGVCPLPTAVGPRGGEAPGVVVSDAASTSEAAAGPAPPARRRIAKTSTKTTTTTTGGHRRRRRRQRSPGLVQTIGREVATDGTDVNVGAGGGGGGGGGGDSPPADRSPLKCGTYLIAHPLMTGYFARSVIVILDHTEEGTGGSSETEEGGGIDEGGVGGYGGGGGGSGGGTYGLIVNRLALQPESADPARRQLDLLRRNWEEKRSRRLEEEDGGGGGGGGGGERIATTMPTGRPSS